MEKSVEKTDLRERIVTTASRLFQAQGVKQVRMDDVARELSVSKKTLYELFADKEELLLEVVKVISMGFHQNIKEIICSSANVLEQIFMLYKWVIEHCREVNPLFFIELMQTANGYFIIPYRLNVGIFARKRTAKNVGG